MEENQKETLRLMAEQSIRAHPMERVLSFAWQGDTYWIKKKQSNRRKTFAKYAVEKEFYYEIAHISIAAQAVDCAPAVVVLTNSYMVLKDGGPRVKDWLEASGTEEEKVNMLHHVGAGLAAIHHAGLYHGRPALRDIVWDGKKVTFLDWENRTWFSDIERRQILDLFLLVQGMYRESWMKDMYVQAAWDGYEAGGGDAAGL